MLNDPVCTHVWNDAERVLVPSDSNSFGDNTAPFDSHPTALGALALIVTAAD
jgi:hypothetical protein